jgi:dihydroxyacetone kinase-like predicted kinase
VLRRVLAGMPAGDLLLIPNDPDPRRVGEQVQPLTDRRVHVVEARTVPQGVAAMVAFASESGLHENFQRMREAAARARSIEVREQPRGGQAEPRAVGLLEGAQVAEGQGLGEALAKVVQAALGSAGARQAEERGSAAPAAGRVTLFYGFGVGPQEAEDLRTGLLRDQPSLEVEALPGGQPGRGLLVWLE